LKGTLHTEQNNQLDFFITITSTMPELKQTSFLMELDMDLPVTSALSLTSPNGSWVALLGTGAREALLATLVSPPLSNSSSGMDTPLQGKANATKQVFSDIRCTWHDMQPLNSNTVATWGAAHMAQHAAA